MRRLSRACKEFSESGLTEDERYGRGRGFMACYEELVCLCRSELCVMIQRLIQELNYAVVSSVLKATFQICDIFTHN